MCWFRTDQVCDASIVLFADRLSFYAVLFLIFLWKWMITIFSMIVVIKHVLSVHKPECLFKPKKFEKKIVMHGFLLTTSFSIIVKIKYNLCDHEPLYLF